MSSQESVIALHKEILRLKQEKTLQRKKISETSADLVYYCKRHAKEDYFLNENCSNNPYKESKQCSVM